MSVVVLWGVEEEELDGDSVMLAQVAGFSPEDLSGVQLPAGMTLRQTEGSIGKGASGTGVGLALEIAEHAINDVASLIAIGGALVALIKRASRVRGRPPAGANADALAAIAAATSGRIQDAPDEWFHARTVPLTTDGNSGTDMRDVWASSFVHDSLGVVLVVFQSSTTRYLGTTIVGVEWFFDGSTSHSRTDEQLADVLDAWFSD
jgi:hypothetical protein